MSNLEKQSIVHHLGLIPDGGRRWAVLQKIPLIESYRISMKKLVEYAHLVYAHGVSSISIYMLSTHNLKRRDDELAPVYEAESEFISQCASDLNARIRIAGNLSLIPGEMGDLARNAEKKTANKDFSLYLCLAYNPFDELNNANQKTSPIGILERCWVDKKIDLVIRTGGAICLSDFLPLQSGYARLIFLKELFNETNSDQILGLIKDHESRHLLKGE